MKNYLKITFNDLQVEQIDILVAQLSDAGFEGFEEHEKSLDAFISEEHFDKELLHEISFKYQLTYQDKVISETNWNKLWESNFEPVIVGNFAAIRADFHKPIRSVQHEVVITPKMSFGTGHHATTYMMIEQMKEINFIGKTVLDFGTGTGILAILAEKLGADHIIAVDNDEWSITNAKENIERNKCNKITLRNASTPISKERFDIILANINKNVILETWHIYVEQLKNNGFILVSGILESDEEDIYSAAKKYRISLKKRLVRNNWSSILFNN